MKITGIGIDLCKVARIQMIRRKNYWQRFLKRVLHMNERLEDRSDEFVASRWAAKEALVKATGFKDLRFDLIEVKKEETGRPCILVHDERLRNLEFFLSISHEEGIAAAVVLAGEKI